MAISGITTTSNNGVERVTNNQTCNGATIDSETVILDGSNSQLDATTAAGLTITRSQIKLDSDVRVGTGNNDADSPLTYGVRANTTNRLRITQNSTVVAGPFSNRVSIFISEVSDSAIIESDNTGELFVYSQQDAVISNATFSGINVWEIYGAPSVFFNVKVEDCNYGFLNWEAGRLDVFGFSVSNLGQSSFWMGGGNSGNNSAFMWNSDTSVDSTNVAHQNLNNSFTSGFTYTYVFQDILANNVPVEGVNVIYRESVDGGTLSEVGRYVTDPQGILTGTYDTQFRVLGASQQRPTLFLQTEFSDTSGSDYSGSGISPNQSYSLITVVPSVEVKSYLHLAPTGFQVGDTLNPTTPVGVLNADGSVLVYSVFGLLSDVGVTASKAAALAYTTIDTLEQMYDRHKSEWTDNDDYPIFVTEGTSINLRGKTVLLDSDNTLVYEVN